MYPRNMFNPASSGFAVANTEEEHRALAGSGYGPPIQEPAADSAPTVDSLRAELDSRGITYDKRWGVERLKQALA